MRAWVKALSLLISISFPLVAQPKVQLQGEFTQGSLIKGQTAPGTKVFFNDKPLPVSGDGQFVFGVGRDGAQEHSLTLLSGAEQLTKTLHFKKRQYDIQHVNGVAQKYVTPPVEVTERIKRENATVRKVRETRSELPFIFDTPRMPAVGRISGVYGSQRVFNGEPRNPHYGLDIAAPVGAPVVAPLSGTVLLAEDLYYSGLTLIIDHGFGISSTFMHLSRFNVALGDAVQQGQQIAEIGATGRVTGAHLDWRINWHQERLDPALLPGLVNAD